MGKHWIIAPPAPEIVDHARRWRVPPAVAQVLVNRGVQADDGAEAFLRPQLKDLHPPETLPGARAGADVIVDAIRRRRRIVLYGDYDVDGTTGVAILWHALRLAGAEVTFYVPHRIEEGYGLSLDSVNRLIADGAGLIVAIDCGVTALAEADACRTAGVPLVIADHHTPRDPLPDADAIVHPLVGAGSLNPHLCGAGVAFKLAWAVAQSLGNSSRVDAAFRDLLMELLPLAALGTIADVVPLVGENRVIARFGLAALPQTRFPGLRALIDSAGLRGEAIDDYDVGFKLAPRINAAGRMGHARLAVELLTRATESRACEIALYLEDHNRARQSTERQIARRAFEIVDENGLAGDARRAIVLADDGWHAGVIGIVASRVVERYHRPTVMISTAGPEGQGSGRSVARFDLGKALESCADHLISHGGHAMAAGLRIEPRNIGAFTEAFVQVANNRLTGDDLAPRLRLDGELELHELSVEAVETVASLGPFGVGNPRPRFATDWLHVADEPRRVGRNQEHLQVALRQNGSTIKGIAFGQGDRAEDLKQHRRCRVAFEPIINRFNNRRTAEMQILDFQFPA